MTTSCKTVTSLKSTPRQWQQEYARKGIPSSYKTRPSSLVPLGLKALKTRDYRGLRSLDLGCGRGRNSFYLASKGFEAHAVDFVPELIQEIKAHAKKRKRKGKIVARVGDVTRKWPYPDWFFDYAVDIYCYKHQAKASARRKYRTELCRVLKPGAVYALSLASKEDGFYGRLPRKHGNQVMDPFTGVGSALFSRADVLREFDKTFKLEKFAKRRKRGRMHGKTYARETLVFVFRKK